MNNDSASTIAQLQEMMCLFRQEFAQLKSASTQVVANPLMVGNNQLPDASGDAPNPGTSDHHPGSGNRKHGRETDNEAESEDSYVSPEDSDNIHAEVFSLSETKEAFLDTTFNKRMDTKTRAQRIEKQGTPDCRWTKCPALDAVVSTTVPKQTVRNDNRVKKLQEY